MEKTMENDMEHEMEDGFKKLILGKPYYVPYIHIPIMVTSFKFLNSNPAYTRAWLRQEQGLGFRVAFRQPKECWGVGIRMPWCTARVVTSALRKQVNEKTTKVAPSLYPKAPTYLNSRLLGYVTTGYIGPSSHYLGNWSPRARYVHFETLGLSSWRVC